MDKILWKKLEDAEETLIPGIYRLELTKAELHHLLDLVESDIEKVEREAVDDDPRAG